MSERKLFECPECRKLSVMESGGWHSHDGAFVRLVEYTKPLTPEPLDALRAEVDRIEPALRKTDWPPMTCMAIPSVLEKADLLVRRVAAARPAGDPERDALLARISGLRRAFRRLT